MYYILFIETVYLEYIDRFFKTFLKVKMKLIGLEMIIIKDKTFSKIGSVYQHSSFYDEASCEKPSIIKPLTINTTRS